MKRPDSRNPDTMAADTSHRKNIPRNIVWIVIAAACILAIVSWLVVLGYLQEPAK